MRALNDNEKRILDMLKMEPFISQQHLAERTQLPRSTVANLISGLQTKGYILGKPYEVNTKRFITCVGGANVDTKLHVVGDYVAETSNPCTTSVSFGGVIRNVAQNLAFLGKSVSLMSILGDDANGDALLADTNRTMDTFATERRTGARTGHYTAVLDQHGDLVAGFADMEICDFMDDQWVYAHTGHLNAGDWVVTDTNVQKSAVEALMRLAHTDGFQLCIVGVSAPKTAHIPQELEGAPLVIVNLDESKAYLGLEDASPYDMAKAWIERGAGSCIITLGGDGCVWSDGQSVEKEAPKRVPAEKIIDVTGAGDSFTAGVLYGLMSDKSLKESVHYGAATAALTLQTDESVRLDLTSELLEETVHA